MGKSRVCVKSSSMVKPAEETWNGCLPLSEWDQIGSIAHGPPTTYFYKPPQNWLAPADRILTTLSDSLSRVLVRFYPVAGRLRSIGGGRMELVCNAEGAQLIEAESDAKLEDFGDDFEDLSPRVDCKTPIHELPLLLVQVTKLSCGSISFAMTMSHVVADGSSAFHLLSEWARLGRGEPLGEAPFLDRTVLQNPDTNDHVAPTTSDDNDDDYIKVFFNRLPLLIGETTTSDGVETTKKEGTEKATLELTKNQVEALKKKAAAKTDYEGLDHDAAADANYSRFEVVTAHAWKCACKARGHKSAQPTAVALCVDVRRRMRPPLPKSYFGNAIVDVLASSRSGEIVSKPLGFVCGRIREAIRRVSGEYVNAVTRYLKNEPDVSRFQFDNLNALGSGGDLDEEEEEEESPVFGDPNVAVTTWVNLPICGIDFGWGKEIYMAPDHDEFDGSLVLLPGRNGDGSIAVAVCLQVSHMHAFKKFFYEDIQPQN